MFPTPTSPMLENAQAIMDSGLKQLEEQQRERAELEFTLQSTYWSLTRLVGKTEADNYVVDLVRLPF